MIGKTARLFLSGNPTVGKDNSGIEKIKEGSYSYEKNPKVPEMTEEERKEEEEETREEAAREEAAEKEVNQKRDEYARRIKEFPEGIIQIILEEFDEIRNRYMATTFIKKFSELMSSIESKIKDSQLLRT